jgi:hypothetical protein
MPRLVSSWGVSVMFRFSRAAQKNGRPNSLPLREERPKVGTRKPVSRSDLTGNTANGEYSTGTPSVLKTMFFATA